MTGLVTPVAPAMLFVPGSDDRKIAKIAGLDTDAVILDLEDAVAISAKADARRKVTTRLREPADDTAIWVRVNPVDSEFFADDVRAVAGAGLAGIVLPEAQRAAGIATGSAPRTGLGS